MNKGLPAIAMTIAVTAAWASTIIPGVTYAIGAGITFAVVWFFVKLIGIR